MVDCNSNIFIETINSLKDILKGKNIKVKGQIKESQIEQLRQGIIDSPIITEETKELLSS